VRIKKKEINYMKNQEDHHKKLTFRGEYINLLNVHAVDFDEKYFLKSIQPLCGYREVIIIAMDKCRVIKFKSFQDFIISGLIV
jgi:hypothetical protein